MLNLLVIRAKAIFEFILYQIAFRADLSGIL